MELLENIESSLMEISATVAVIALIILGLVIMFKGMKPGGNGLREAFSGLGAVALGVFLVFGGAAIIAALQGFSNQL